MAMQTMKIAARTTTTASKDRRVTDVIRQAEDLLSQLAIAQQEAELRQSESGRPDPMKSITGRSSIETAIARTESLLGTMHELEQTRETNNRPAVIHVNSAACDEMLRPKRNFNSEQLRSASAQTSLALLP